MSIISNEHQPGRPFDRPEHPPVQAEMPGIERFKFDLLEVVGQMHGEVRGTFHAPSIEYMSERRVWLMRRLQYWHRSDVTYDLLVFTLAREALNQWLEWDRARELEEA